MANRPEGAPDSFTALLERLGLEWHASEEAQRIACLPPDELQARESCATGALRPTRVVAGVADSEQVGRRVERSLRIFDAEYLRDRSFAAALAKITAPDRDIVGKPKPRRHVGGV